MIFARCILMLVTLPFALLMYWCRNFEWAINRWIEIFEGEDEDGT